MSVARLPRAVPGRHHDNGRNAIRILSPGGKGDDSVRKGRAEIAGTDDPQVLETEMFDGDVHQSDM